MGIYKYQYVTENAFAEKAILLAFDRGGNVKDGLKYHIKQQLIYLGKIVLDILNVVLDSVYLGYQCP